MIVDAIVAIVHETEEGVDLFRFEGQIAELECQMRRATFDFNPIEMAFHSLKSILRSSGLWRCIASFIPNLHKVECLDYFRHTGYASL
jgi:hypothetical protein